MHECSAKKKRRRKIDARKETKGKIIIVAIRNERKNKIIRKNKK